MSFFRDLAIGNKLLSAFSLMALIICIIGLMGLAQLNAVNANCSLIVDQQLPRLLATTSLDTKLSDFRRRQLRVLEPHPSAEAQLYQERLQQDLQSIRQSLEQLQQSLNGSDQPGQLALQQTIQQQWASYETMHQQMLSQSQKGDLAGAASLLNGTGDKQFRDVKQQVADLMKQIKQQASQTNEQGKVIYTHAQWLTWSLIGIGVLLVVICAWGISQQIKAPLVRLLQQAEQVADGNLTTKLDYNRFSRDEIGIMARAFGKMQTNLHQLVAELIHAIDAVKLGAAQVDRGAQDTAEGQQRQQSEITYLATAMTEMSSTVNEVARNTTHAASAAQEANAAAAQGSDAVSATLTTIQKVAAEVEQVASVVQALDQDSNHIGMVLEVIRGIADQTNLLALNAAIEAARAGDQGRGFAVVADEVRTLAKRTQDSTAEINTIIASLQQRGKEAVHATQQGKLQVSECVSQAAEAGQRIVAISEAVAEISDMSNQIATATEEQNKVAEDLSHNISNINAATQEIGHHTAETARASKELYRLAHSLSELTQRFRL